VLHSCYSEMQRAPFHQAPPRSGVHPLESRYHVWVLSAKCGVGNSSYGSSWVSFFIGSIDVFQGLVDWFFVMISCICMQSIVHFVCICEHFQSFNWLSLLFWNELTGAYFNLVTQSCSCEEVRNQVCCSICDSKLVLMRMTSPNYVKNM